MDKIKVLLTGGSGVLGSELLKIFDKNKYIFFAPSSEKLDITNQALCDKAFNNYVPDIVIHAAGYTDTAKAEIDYIRCTEINVNGTINLVKCVANHNCRFVFISTDYVFDGKIGLYKPEDPINPIGKYAKTKAAAELIASLYDNSLIIRTSFLCYNFPYNKAFTDQWTSKDYIDIMAPKILDIALSTKTGVIHCGSKRRSMFDIAKERMPNVLPSTRKEYNLSSPFDTSFYEK